MYTVELAWFCFDLPDYATVDVQTSPPNPLFPDSRVTTRWAITVERFEIAAVLSATRDLSDLSRLALDKGGKAVPLNQNGIPAMRFGAYDQERTQIDWWFQLQGLTLSLTLTAKGYPHTLPTDAERVDHEAIIKSVRRVGARLT